ncbi:MAG TPA: glycosyltransferase [Candidatus Binatia bacterium]|jgi:glycosyltransferase involved in cell wall biosynthesis|nr:glycosyltransferase [Candidatus Binatia bacterium]
MPDFPKTIDVVIPVKATVPWLLYALESIARQTLQPRFITVVDDGADNPEFIRTRGTRLFSERFRLIKSPGQGISAALNTAIAASDAHWIARMDADDIAHPDRLNMQLNFLATHSGTIGCGTQIRFINSSNRILGYSNLPSEWSQITQQIQSRTCFVHSSMMIRRDALLATTYRPSMDGAEDVDLILRLAEKGRVINLRDALLDYRLHLTQESFRARARGTAVQELAFRLALSRRIRKFDPLEHGSDLAERFIEWRLSDPAYVRSRTFLTALRYGRTYLRGLDFWGFSQMALVGLNSIPNSWSSLHISWQVVRRAGAALLNQPTPFAELNVP